MAIPFYILCFSLVVIPLCGSLSFAPFIGLNDSAVAKEFLSIFFIFLISITTYALGPVQGRANINWPLYALIAYLPFSIYNAPPLKLMLGNENLGGLWMWRALAWSAGYFMLYQAIQRLFPAIFVTRKPDIIAKCIGWVAVFSSIYAIVQFLNIDQFQIMRPYEEIGQKTAGGITAIIGSPIYLGVFLGICLPFCVLFMRGWQTALVCVAILMCESDIATCGGVVTLALLAGIRAKNQAWLKAGAGAGIIALALVFSFWHQIRPMVSDNGRFPIWREVIREWRGPEFTMGIAPDMPEAQKKELSILNKRTWPITGRGPGSFEFFFGPKNSYVNAFGNPVIWNDPHNIYLRVLYEIGVIGLGLFLAVIGVVFWRTYPAARRDPWTLALFCSLFFCCLAGLTTPMFVVEPLRFYVVIIFALLSNAFSKQSHGD